MSMKKRGVIVAMCFAVCLATFCMPSAMAANVGSGNSEIMPLMEYIYDAYCNLSITDGTAKMYAYVSGHSSTATKCEIGMELQEKGLLFWNTIATWTTSENGRSTELNASETVIIGKKYRLVATVTVWSGTASETQTITAETTQA